MAGLFTKTGGAGKDLVLVHGWGLSSCIWTQLAEKLEHRYRVTVVDLPGHGNSPVLADMSADSVINALCEAVPEHAIWMGWSLGGMLSLAAAQKAKAAALVMLAASPRFVVGTDWPHAMQGNVMTQFRDDLERDYRRTLNRFLLLQTRNSDQAGQSLSSLKSCLTENEPDVCGLEAGLSLLGGLDLRNDFSALSIPCEVVLGGRDTLMPAAVANDLCKLNDRAVVSVLDHAGHALMLSHEAACVAAIDAVGKRLK